MVQRGVEEFRAEGEGLEKVAERRADIVWSEPDRKEGVAFTNL